MAAALSLKGNYRLERFEGLQRPFEAVDETSLG
jgi:hypothetical protein